MTEAAKQLKRITNLNPEHASLMMAFTVIDNRIRQLDKESRDELFALQKCLITADDDDERVEILQTMMEILDDQPTNYIHLKHEEIQSPKEGLSKWISFVSNRIKEERENAGLTQTQLAEKSGLPQSHISRLEKGQHSPTNFTLEKIAKALKISIGKFDPSA